MACWKNPMLQNFFSLYLEEVGKGCITLKRNIPWVDISLELKKKKGIYLSISQLKSRWKNEKLRYTACSKLVSAAGSTYYDPIKNKVNWSKQQWEEYLKINSQAEQCFYRSLENSTEMMSIFDV
ncbi:hypothetical protein M9H77_28407 [Catharanthus roseus]|uniref:Uncharacterized protein n=1 Tax=Catharanthus roseus TaxID=4058 RepID=A0ACC0AG71_CATRO|nr:hypothetical protein M9H77_28407 [Catharanthus roseus]